LANVDVHVRTSGIAIEVLSEIEPETPNRFVMMKEQWSLRRRCEGNFSERAGSSPENDERVWRKPVDNVANVMTQFAV
jgi:hypothetical protein